MTPTRRAVSYTHLTTPETEAEVVSNVEGTGGAIDRYNEWQVGALGRDINPCLLYTSS